MTGSANCARRIGATIASRRGKRAVRTTRLATHDDAIGTANLLAMAQHAGAQIVKVDASHVAMISQPDAVVRLIRAAANSVH